MIIQDFKRISHVLREGGLAAPLCWYKIMTNGVVSEDDKRELCIIWGASDHPLTYYHLRTTVVPLDSYDIKKPVFFGAALQDYICLDSLGKGSTARYCKGPTTIKSFDTGHWVMHAAKDEVSRELDGWIRGL